MTRSILAILLICLAASAHAVDLSNPRKLIFVGDSAEKKIDVLSIDTLERLHRIETSIHPDHIVVAPFAPVLLLADVAAKKAVLYDLESQREVVRLDLPLSPRHVVLDTTGAKAGISDSEKGGFILINLYRMEIQLSLPEFPATGPVLFDPNDIDIYFTNSKSGSLGLLNTNTAYIHEQPLADGDAARLSAPSRSLDARYIYVSNLESGEALGVNAFSRVVFRSFDVGEHPTRPYTTPQGTFLYLMDEIDGRLLSVRQNDFATYADIRFKHSVELVAVGEFDRSSLFLSKREPGWSIYDNLKRDTVASGEFRGTPVSVLGSADGRTAFVAFSDLPAIAVVDLKHHIVRYVPATENGARSFTIGLSNNVCH